MCGGGPDIPAKTDPAAEREKADALATQSANEKAAALKVARQRQSLLAAGAGGGNGGTPATSTVLAQGKPLLGS
ncbi:hypothetical protein LMG18090_04039 [Ralstonia mannitolilytica]|uniref:hypothetical protein n=1 Tax=Ralstonia mannitolilytica TaxID=105219 RepID=UPI0007B01B88|nr:hypothetical protein [Ralstonia mannitolilytica]ANA34462.1 hypothetical protein VZ52_14275 [Ralstonia mannitolilytica]CAJ0800737.1 hypothetical protein LMG18090_04039 [Ralstonia mannitolilytica]